MVWLQRAVPIIGILLLLQRNTVQPTPQQYHLINAPLTWHEAQSFCRVKYTDLATVNDMIHRNQLVRTLGSGASDSWIGLKRGKTGRWMWSDGRGTAHFTKWGEGEPNNVGGVEFCAEMSEGLWIDMSCEEAKDFVCYERQQDGAHRYVYYTEERNWVNSNEHCRSRHTDLAFVNTEPDNSEIANLANTRKVWIGLFNDAWTWSDGGGSSFRYWLSGSQGWGDCASVSVSQQGRWVGAQCNQKASFVCQGDLKVKRMVIKLKVHSEVDLTNPPIRDALLKKLETGMKQKHLTDFKLSWRSDKSGLVFQREQLEPLVAKETGCPYVGG